MLKSYLSFYGTYVSLENWIKTSCRFSLITSNASKHFKEKAASGIGHVQAKLDELKLALISATSAKFCHKHSEALVAALQQLIASKADVEATASIVKELERAAEFTACSKATLQKALGSSATELIEMIETNKKFYSLVKAAVPMLIPLLHSRRELSPGTLLHPALEPFVEMMQSEESLDHVRKIFPRIAGFLSALGGAFGDSAKDILAHNALSCVGFLKELVKEDCSGEVTIKVCMLTCFWNIIHSP